MALRRTVRRVGVLASGSGTILQALIDADLPIAAVIVDRPCRAMEIADRGGIAVELVERESFGPEFDRLAYTERVVDALKRHEIDLVAMAGFMTVLERPIHDAYGGMITNTHPSLLPEFRGAHAVADTLAAGVTETGCTVHRAVLEVDEGPILAQETVPVRPDDTVETLHERIKEVERRLYPQVIRQLLEGP
jgi:phosphoribosylglycinamide formyltransferase 1